MSWIPSFQLGLWNAWIPMLYLPLHPLIMMAIYKAIGTGDLPKKMGDVPYDKSEQRAFVTYMAILVLMLVYSVFLPLRLGTAWFWVGILIYLFGLGIFLTAIVNTATTPLGRPFTTGAYRLSRHPMLVAATVAHIGVSVASASWVFLVASIVVQALSIPEAVAEERGCAATYGEEYREYMSRTPRWIGARRASSK
jgi:protein-S-isoprenylcysteine O-methyltransferase Ste14